jgi:hypothetical protein
MPPTTAPPMTRNDAAQAILVELGDVQARLRELDQERVELLARRRELYARGRGLRPAIPGAEMARACGISDAALVLSARRAPKV